MVILKVGGVSLLLAVMLITYGRLSKWSGVSDYGTSGLVVAARMKKRGVMNLSLIFVK